MEKLHIIEQLPFFKDLTPEDKEALAQIDIRAYKFEPGATIIKANEKDTYLLFLVKGNATVLSQNGIAIGRLKPGEVFGEVAFLAERPRSASVIADSEVMVLRINRTVFQSLAPELREKIKDKLVRQIVLR